ncbi:MAG: 1-phosphofructokinase family hexose kinase [Treponemataceae bacterium]|nr:1-phosphofructokinase family hexose kinase [Treponemataceae bacterium]
MIYTVTCNPSLDYVIDVPGFAAGTLNRTSAEELYAGGKGINVSWVLHELGVPTKALGFTAGFTGAEIERRVREQGIESGFIQVPEEQGLSRINVKMRSAAGGETDSTTGNSVAGNIAATRLETEINGMGPRITENDIEQLKCRLSEVTPDDMVVLAGNIPASLPDTLYCELMELLKERGVPVTVDASGSQLNAVLQYQPFLVKPNNHELGGLFGVEITDRSTALEYARRLQQLGPRNVLVSLGSKGAVLVTEDGSSYEREARHITVVNTIGAGDSMVAGFLAGWLKTGSYETAFEWGVAAGEGCAASTGLPTGRALLAAGCVS